MKRENHRGALIFGAVVGALSGGVATLFVTPWSGAQLREKLLHRGDGVQQRVSEATSGVRGRSRAAAGPYVGRVVEVVRTGKELGGSAAQRATGMMQRESNAQPAPADLAGTPPSEDITIETIVSERPAPESGGSGTSA